MARILVAGGTGSLGSAMINTLRTTHHQVRIMSQDIAPSNLNSDLEWATADITTGIGVTEALEQVNIVVNCLGNYQNVLEVDVLGVKRLAELSQAADVSHFYHISIVGIDRVDYEFFRHKLAAEQFVIDSGVAYSIQRVTQFHSFMFYLMMQFVKPVQTGYLLPTVHDAVFQPTDTHDIAIYALPSILGTPRGRLPDVGGSEILRVDDLANAFLTAQGVQDAILINPEQGFFPSSSLPALRLGVHTVPNHRYGKVRWGDFVQRQITQTQ